MRRMLLSALVLVAFTILVSACSSGGSEEAADQAPIEEVQLDDHEEEEDVTRVYVDPPDEFVDLTNPFSGDADAITKGKEIFEDKCVECHGSQGAGDGPTSANLNPKPASLNDSMMMEELSDGYLFWRVTKGGLMEPFNSAMKAWEMALTEEQRWQVISYVRTLSEQ
jgi:mono/diheme cytochrome c family protein